jgi:hypothetical protein
VLSFLQGPGFVGGAGPASEASPAAPWSAHTLWLFKVEYNTAEAGSLSRCTIEDGI